MPILSPSLTQRSIRQSQGQTGAGGDRTLGEVEQDHIESVLKRCHGNRLQAARILAVSPAALWRKLKA